MQEALEQLGLKFAVDWVTIERQIINLLNHKNMSDDFKKHALSELKEIIKNK